MEARRLGWRSAGVAASLYLILAVIWTWPLVLHLASTTPTAKPDSRLTTWILAWDAHVLVKNPTDLFQAPYFYPQPDTLAYTDHMLGLGVMAAPIDWISGNMFLAHNAVFLLSVAFAGFAAFLLAHELTGSVGAALLTGTAYAFAPQRAAFQGLIQILSSGWLPMTFFGLFRWWRTRRVSPLVLASASFVMSTLTSWYLGIFLTVGLAVAVVALMLMSRPKKLALMMAQAAAAAAVIAALLAPFAIPYLRVGHRFPGSERSLQAVASGSAHLTWYLGAPPANLIYGKLTSRWSSAGRPYGPGNPGRYPKSEQDLFPGLTVVFLAAIGLGLLRRNQQDRNAILTFLLIGLAGVALTIGAAPVGIRRFFPWTFLERLFEAFRALRVVVRANVLTTLGLSVAAGFGLRAILRRFSSRWLPWLAVALVFVEGLAIPLRLGPAPRAIPLYARLAARQGGIIEIPAGKSVDVYYMLYHTVDWRPLANGYSGFFPPSYLQVRRATMALPDPRSIAYLRSLGIRTLIIHPQALGQRWALMEESLLADPEITLLISSPDIVVFDIGAR